MAFGYLFKNANSVIIWMIVFIKWKESGILRGNHIDIYATFF
jgi:hypothetical protein